MDFLKNAVEEIGGKMKINSISSLMFILLLCSMGILISSYKENKAKILTGLAEVKKSIRAFLFKEFHQVVDKL